MGRSLLTKKQLAQPLLVTKTLNEPQINAIENFRVEILNKLDGGC